MCVSRVAIESAQSCDGRELPAPIGTAATPRLEWRRLTRGMVSRRQSFVDECAHSGCCGSSRPWSFWIVEGGLELAAEVCFAAAVLVALVNRRAGIVVTKG